MRHGAESPRPIVPDTCGFYGVVRLLIVGSNPTLTTLDIIKLMFYY
jgi:hypothetical protein